MLIKDNSGDWGVCTAAWKGLTPGVPGRPGIRVLTFLYSIHSNLMFTLSYDFFYFYYKAINIERVSEVFREIQAISKCILLI